MTASEIHRAMFDAIRNKDLAGLRDMYHDDYVYMAGDGIEQKGVDAGLAVAETYITAFPDLSPSIEHEYQPREDVSIVELRVTGTHQGELQGIPATNRRIDLAAANVIEVRDGKILREREYYDGAAMLQQLGVIEG
jgi:steroid delta-isomerase-like uncharacterized protein